MSAWVSIKFSWRIGIINEERHHFPEQVLAESDHLASHFHFKGQKLPHYFVFAAQWFFPCQFHSVIGQVQGEKWLFWHLWEVYLILIYLWSIRENIFLPVNGVGFSFDLLRESVWFTRVFKDAQRPYTDDGSWWLLSIKSFIYFKKRKE